MSDDAFSWLTSDQIYTRKRKSGVSSLEILALPDDLRRLINQVMRYEPVRLEELIDALGQPADDVRGQVALLMAQGWLQTTEINGDIHYRVHLARRRARSLPPGIWQILEGTWNVQLFRYFGDDEKADFSRAFKLKQFEAGQIIFTVGEWGQTMYLIDAGLIELVRHDADGREVVLARLKPGDIMGEVAVLLGERRWATARAVDSVSVWSLHKDDLDRLLARSPSAGLSIQREIEHRVHGLERRPSAPPSGHLSQERPGDSGKQLNPMLIVGPGAMELAQALWGYTGERILVLDLWPDSPAPPHLHSALSSGELAAPHLPTAWPHSAGGTGGRAVERRPAQHLDSKKLAAALRQGLDEFDRVIIAAPTELHGPLMGVIGLIELVVDLSGTEVPWVIAAARRRWTIPAAPPALRTRLRARLGPTGRSAAEATGASDRLDVKHVARRLCHRVVGLALSGGAARALAHIGALRALEEAQLPIDMIASTGMGAVVAGLYAAGFSVDDLTDLAIHRARDLNPFDGSLNLRLASRSALYAGKRARNALNKLLEGRTFADLRLPLYVVAADLESGQPVILNQGPLSDAMEASLALAGLVAPAEISASPIESLNGRSLVDGSLINPMPANVLAEHGAGLIIGISVIPNLAREGMPSQDRTDLTSTWLRLRDQLAYAALMNSLRHLDTLIMPQVDRFSGTDFDHAAELIAAGLAATQQEIDHIQRLLAPNFARPT